LVLIPSSWSVTMAPGNLQTRSLTKVCQRLSEMENLVHSSRTLSNTPNRILLRLPLRIPPGIRPKTPLRPSPTTPQSCPDRNKNCMLWPSRIRGVKKRGCRRLRRGGRSKGFRAFLRVFECFSYALILFSSQCLCASAFLLLCLSFRPCGSLISNCFYVS
jgi:hypothetical protein